MAARKILHIISQSHLDPVWLWPARDGAAETLTTLQSAVDRAAETPSFRYTRSSASAYRWARDMDPLLYEQIHRLVAEGRWEVVGGWIEQCDCNLPSAESFIRQAVLAKRFFKEQFGLAGVSTVGYSPDAFGHAGGLPQILRKTGFDTYAFMRSSGSAGSPEPPLLFQWEAADGSRVLGVRIPTQYSQSYAATADHLEASLRKAATAHFAPGFEVGAFWLGIGNHGGGPTREHIARILELQADDSLPELRFSSLADFSAAVRNSNAYPALPVWRGEIGFCFRGCYSANSATKRSNRHCEQALFASEALSVMEGEGRCAADPAITEAWWRLLFNQFHDILAGTCVAPVEAETRARYGAVLTATAETILRSSARIARRVDTAGEAGGVLCVVNPLPWPRRERIQFDTFKNVNGRERITHLENRDGSEVYPVQWQTAASNFGPWALAWGKLTACVDLPPCGFRVFRIATETLEEAESLFIEGAADGTQFQKRGEDRAEPGPDLFSNAPVLDSIKTPSGCELLRGAVSTVVMRDAGGTWGDGVASYRDEIGRPEWVSSEILEDGPVLTLQREKSRWGGSEIWMDVIRQKDSPCVELRFRINWQEKRQILKLEIPTAMRPDTVLAKMPAEGVCRPADGNEYPWHDWLMLQASLEGAERSFGLVNESCYSYDAGSDGVLSVILARSAPHAELLPFPYTDTRNVDFLDQGWIERRFLMVPSDGQVSSGQMDRLAREFQVPPELVPDSAHGGQLDWQGSMFSVDPAEVAVLAIKPAEQGDGFIVRLQAFCASATGAELCAFGCRFRVSLCPWEIKTVHIHPEAGTWRIRTCDALS